MNPTNSAEALSQLQQSQAQAQNPNDILQARRQQLGVPQAEQTVTGLRGAIDSTTKLLKQIAPGVMGRTGNSLVTSGQANRIIQNESAPVSATLQDQTDQYGRANEDATKLRSEAETTAGNIYQGQKDKQSYLQNLYDTLYGREQNDAKTAADERDRQEDIRRYNISQSSSGSSSKSGGSSKASTAVNKAEVQQHVATNLSKNSGTDGNVSRVTWGAAMNDFVGGGLGTIRDFWKRYGNYVNEKTKSQYPGFGQR